MVGGNITYAPTNKCFFLLRGVRGVIVFSKTIENVTKLVNHADWLLAQIMAGLTLIDYLNRPKEIITIYRMGGEDLGK